MMMVTASESFANTPSGYVVGVIAPVILALFLRKSANDRARWRDMQMQIANVGVTQSEQTRALAVLVAQANDDRPNIQRIPTLAQGVAVLEDWRAGHERWAERENSRIQIGLDKRLESRSNERST